MEHVGFGTMRLGEAKPEQMYEATLGALRAGCRHIDTAELYADTAKHVGRAISESGLPREELFVTSKLRGMPIGPYEQVRARVEAMLREMGLRHFDLLLVHWPGPESLDMEGEPSALREQAPLAWFKEHIGEAWANMQRLRSDGLSKQVGVSNFYSEQLALLKEACAKQDHPPPFANELFIDICHQERGLVRSLLEAGVRVIGYRSLAFLPVLAMARDVGDAGFEEVEAVREETKAASVQQLILKWLMDQGVSVIVGSTRPEHMKENLEAEALQLGQEALERLAALDGSETVEMCGGTDEYAMAWRELGSPAKAAALREEGEGVDAQPSS